MNYNLLYQLEKEHNIKLLETIQELNEEKEIFKKLWKNSINQNNTIIKPEPKFQEQLKHININIIC